MKYLLALCFVIFTKTLSAETYYNYRTNSKDSLSAIIYSITEYKIYGSQGVLNKIISLNNYSNSLSIGTIIKIPANILTRTCNYKIIENNELIIFKIIHNKKEANKLDLICENIDINSGLKIENNNIIENNIQIKNKSERSPDNIDAVKTWGLSFYPYLKFSRIDLLDLSNNAKGAILSNTIYGFTFKWIQLLNKNTETNIFINIETLSFKALENRIFTNNNFSTLNFGFLINYNLYKTLKIQAKINYGELYFFRSPSIDKIMFDTTHNFELSSGLILDLFKNSYYNIIISTNLAYTPASYLIQDYKTRHNLSFINAISLEQKFKNFSIVSEFIYKKAARNTVLFKQTHSEVYFGGGIKCLL